MLGAIVAATGRRLSNDIYFQVGLLATIGLSSKNAILIVEFAKAQMEEGKELVEATLEAVRMRLRPILMTSLAFGFGVLPLATATGAGAGSQNAIGTGVLGGTIFATALGIFFVPLFYVVIKRIFKDKPKAPDASGQRTLEAFDTASHLDHHLLGPAGGACTTLTPDYERPAAPVPTSFRVSPRTARPAP